jgi:alanine racemase
MRYRPTVAEIDLDAIRHNVRLLKPETSELMAVVKANGYGHGATPVARAAVQAGATWLGVALVEEGLRLREEGIQAPILVLSELPPGSEEEALRATLTPTLYTAAGLRGVVSAAASLGLRPVGHVKVDTGMHRVGVAPDHATAYVRAALDAGVHLEGLWTHFAVSDDPSDGFTRVQLARFLEVSERLRALGVRPPYLHAANSGAVLNHPDAHLDLVRVGIALYGVSPGDRIRSALRAAMTWRSAVSMVKRVGPGEGVSYGLRYRTEGDTTLATVPVGYADGYRRALSNRGPVLIRGRRYRVAGTVTMDQLVVDCRDDPVEPGDEVVLIGRQGGAAVTAEELATLCDTIAYEIVSGVGDRVPREYVSR